MSNCEETIPNSFHDFVNRFHTLAEEAESYGFISMTSLMDSDPIKRVETKDLIWRGGTMACVGLCRWSEIILLNAKVGDE